jgi:AcrR family transcriptional regulator
VSEQEPTRLRIVVAAYDCVARHGIAATTLDAASQEAGVARATVYRHFPGGRDELIAAVVAWEVERFFERLRDDIGEAPDFATYLERGLMAAHRRLGAHEVLQHVLEGEAERLIPPLAGTIPMVVGALTAEFRGRLRRERLRAGVDLDEAAELLARMMLSHMGSPGCWDLDDPAEVRDLVRGWLLAGVLERATPEDCP